MYPDVKVVRRMGEVNAWDNAEFRDAIKATNKSQIVVAGIVTDVCTLTIFFATHFHHHHHPADWI
jgi:isochorismate hydrolase